MLCTKNTQSCTPWLAMAMTREALDGRVTSPSVAMAIERAYPPARRETHPHACLLSTGTVSRLLGIVEHEKPASVLLQPTPYRFSNDCLVTGIALWKLQGHSQVGVI